MTTPLTRAEVERIAELARLQLSEAEIEAFTRQLAQILDMAQQLRDVDTTDVPPTTHVMSRHEALRPDQVRASLTRAEALANAPDGESDEGFFKVPKVIE